MSKLEEDKASIQTGRQQLNLLKEKPTHLVVSIKLYKSLKDLSSNFNAHNNIASFSDLVGDLAPEMEFWADPVLHKLYLLPIARSKDEGMEKEPSQPQKEKRPTPQGKKPQSRFSSIKKVGLVKLKALKIFSGTRGPSPPLQLTSEFFIELFKSYCCLLLNRESTGG
jgi:hypothetical protein